MTRIKETVRVFLNKPATSQVEIMNQFDWEWDWSRDQISQRNEFFKNIKDTDRVEEFCDYILGVKGE